MASFSIDDVRDSFTTDIRSLLAQIEIGAQGLLEFRQQIPELPKNQYDKPLFEAIAAAGHTLAGTGGLVGAESLHRSGRLIEKMTRDGQMALLRAQAQLEHAARLAQLCYDSGQTLSIMLDLELEHRSADALLQAQALEQVYSQLSPPEQFRTNEVTFVGEAPGEKSLARAAAAAEAEAEARGEPARPPVTSSPSVFSFDLAPEQVAIPEEEAAKAQAMAQGAEEAPEVEAADVVEAEAVAPQDAEVDAELAAAFQEEARESVAALHEHLTALVADAGDLATAAAAERVYHTLKGASATVGFMGVSRIASALQDLLGEIAEGQKALAGPVLAQVLADTDRMLNLVGLPALGLSASGPAEAAAVSAEEFSFGEEAPAAAAEAPEAAAGGEDFSFGEEERGGAPAAAEAAGAGAGEAAAEAGLGMDEELMSIFQSEAREAVVTLQGHLQALAENPKELSVAEQIERIFHTLKGASATVGLSEVSQLAVSLQRMMEPVLEGSMPVSTDFLGRLIEATNKLLSMAKLQLIPADLVGPKVAPMSEEAVANEEVKSFFLVEAQEVLSEARRLVEALAGASAERGGEIRANLGRLFHRMKGSSLVIGLQAASEEAARLQRLAEEQQGPQVGPKLAEGVASLRKLLGLDAPPVATAAAPSSVRSSAAASQAPAVSTAVHEPVHINAEPELWEAFLLECTEILEGLERQILSLEEVSQPRQALQALFRLYHTLKGAVNAVGLAPTGKMIHVVEDFIEGLLEAAILPSMREVANLLLEVQSEIRRHLRQAPSGSVEVTPGKLEARVGRVAAGGRVSDAGPASGSSASASDSQISGEGEAPSSAASSRAAEVEAAERRFIRVSTDRLDSLMNLAGELVVGRSRLGTRVSVLRNLQFDLSRSRKALIERVENFREQHEFANLDGTKAAASRATAARVTAALAPDRQASAVALGHERPQAGAGGGAWSEFSDIELDRYEDIHVLSRSLAEISDDFNEIFGQLFRELASFADDSEMFGRIVTGIQSEVTRARMVPLETVFTRLRLPVRDAASREKKEVRVVPQGEDVNLDKTIADALFPPMLHLVRNCVAHGIETEVGRQAAGKDRVGTITLGARQESGQIVLEVKDDGRGLDLVALHARGVAMGLIRPETPITHPAVKDLVFAPGLSTNVAAGAVSGRGVGGDVVRRSIERLNGDIRVETAPGKGTTFVITLPLTLAIARALLIRVGESLYAVPLYFAEHILELDPKEVVESFGVRRMKLGDSFLPLRRADELFGYGGGGSATGPVVILRLGDLRMAVQVDSVVAQEEVVVKSMGDLLTGHPLFAGVTIRGNGELVLIVDVAGIMESIGMSRATAQEHRLPAAVAAEAVEAGVAVKEARAQRGAERPRVRPAAPAKRGPAVEEPSEATGAMEESEAVLEAKAESALPSRAKVEAPKAPAAPAAPAAAAPAAAEKAVQPAPGPRAAVAPTGRTAVVAPALPGLGRRGPQLRALVVDDSLSVRKVAERILSGLGAKVTLAVDGMDGLTKLRDETFDIIFTDLEMPRMHGYEFIREVRFLPTHKDLPIVVVSSRSGQKHQDQARQLGANDYIAKPFNAESLDAALKRWVRGKDA